MSVEAERLYTTYTNGPLGLGERSSILSKYVQEKLLVNLCYTEWKEFRHCIREHSDKWFSHRHCKHLLTAAKDCEQRYVLDPDEIRKFEEEYLAIRSQYRRTGIGQSFMHKERMRAFFKEN